MSIEVSTSLDEDDIANHVDWANISPSLILALSNENTLVIANELASIRLRRLDPIYVIKRLRDLADAIEKEL